MTELNDKAQRIACLRNRIDAIDAQLLSLFEERMEAAEEIGGHKRLCGSPVFDREREKTVKASRLEKAAPRIRPYAAALVETLIMQSKKLQAQGMNLYLTGMPDSGKTRLGKRLAVELDRPLLDMDKHIMNSTGMSVDVIFEQLGEGAFRSYETMTLKTIAEKGGYVVATGGGTPFYNNNAELMKSSGLIVFLDRSLDRLLEQDTKNRPLLRQSNSVESSVRQLYASRYSGYQSIATLIIDPDEEAAIDEISRFYQDWLAAIVGQSYGL